MRRVIIRIMAMLRRRRRRRRIGLYGDCNGEQSSPRCASGGVGATREEHWCLLSSAENPKNRTVDVAQAAAEDAAAVAGYAQAFNAQTARLHNDEEGGSHDADSVVGVRVCVPVVCFAIGGHASQVARPGQAVTLSLYPFSQVTKFVFEGKDCCDTGHCGFRDNAR